MDVRSLISPCWTLILTSVSRVDCLRDCCRRRSVHIAWVVSDCWRLINLSARQASSFWEHGLCGAGTRLLGSFSSGCSLRLSSQLASHLRCFRSPRIVRSHIKNTGPGIRTDILLVVIPISSLGPLSTGKGCLADRANIDVVGTYASFTAFDTGAPFSPIGSAQR